MREIGYAIPRLRAARRSRGSLGRHPLRPLVLMPKLLICLALAGFVPAVHAQDPGRVVPA